jgi:hypothetical protein
VSIEQILAAASTALGRPCRRPIELGAGLRARVLRCHTGQGTVIVKAFQRNPEARRSFVAEAAGLRLGDFGPPVLAVDPDTPLIVMGDLGTAPSLADKLLGDDPAEAEHALLAWARGYGRLATATVGREPDLARWEHLLEQTGPARGDDTSGGASTLGVLMHQLLAVTEQWNVPPLPLYPSLRP